MSEFRAATLSWWRVIGLLWCGSAAGVAAASNVIAWGADFAGQTAVPAGLTNAVAIAAGWQHTAALTAGHTVVAWGYNGDGETNIPADLANIQAIARGAFDTLALGSDQKVRGWGDNSSGQLTAPIAASNTVAISGGEFHSLALQANGAVVAWGNNSVGQTNVPSDLRNAVAVACGDFHNLALRADGTVVAWGDNSFGQTNVPSGLAGVVAIAAGSRHSLALQVDGTVSAWGDDSFGQASVPKGLNGVVAIAAGNLHSLALKRDGTVVAWGDNSFGQASVPAELTNVSAIAAGGYHSLALIGAGPPFVSGGGVNRTVLMGTTVAFAATATGTGPLRYQWLLNGTMVPGATNAVLTLPDIGPGMEGLYAVVASNAFGVVTDSWTALSAVPLFFTKTPESQTVLMGSTASVSVAVDSVRPASYQWLFNGKGTLTGATNAILNLSDLQPSQAGAYSVAASNDFGVVISPAASLKLTPFQLLTAPQPQTTFINGKARFTVEVNSARPLAYQWRFNGSNSPGATNGTLTLDNVQLGQTGDYSVRFGNDFGSATTGVAHLQVNAIAAWGQNSGGQTSVPAGLTNVLAIAAGALYSLAVKADGTVAAWGWSAAGQTSVPAKLSNVVAIAAGYEYSLALKADRTVAGWGVSGRVTVPPEVTNAIALAGEADIGLALNRDRTIRAWWDYGQEVPGIPGLTNVVAIAGGGTFGLALNGDGTVVAWGDNSVGQTNVPAFLTNAVAIAAGYDHGLALRADGTVVAWGSNVFGETNVPAGLSNVVSIAGGYGFCLALNADGTVVEWGNSVAAVPAGLRNVIAIAAGRGGDPFALALVGPGPPIARVPLQGPTWTSNVFQTSMPTRSGRIYVLEYQNFLGQESWTALPPESGSGRTLILRDPSATGSQRLYRVQQW